MSGPLAHNYTRKTVQPQNGRARAFLRAPFGGRVFTNLWLALSQTLSETEVCPAVFVPQE